MNLAIFDLDNTLLDGDSDHAWGEFLVSKGLVDGAAYQAKNNEFYEAYKKGSLDIVEYQEFVLGALREFTLDQLGHLHAEFMAEVVLPMITERSQSLLSKHRKQGDYLLIITATNDFITTPIAQHLKVDGLIATQAEMQANHYTGKVSGVASFQTGKIQRLKSWVEQQAIEFGESTFYSDSINDLPLLEWVDTPVVANGDEGLLQIAADRNWPSINLRHNQ